MSARSNIPSLPFPPGSVAEPGEQTYISGGSLMLLESSVPVPELDPDQKPSNSLPLKWVLRMFR